MSLEPFLAEMRPKIHRYCARMTGSVIDGEDVTQDTLLKAVGALKRLPVVDHPDRWLFRIAHNCALDFLRRRTRTEAILSGEDPETIADFGEMEDNVDIVSTSLRTFMRLPVTQRGPVILKDVFGYSLAEICDVMDASVPAVKSALHRGRERLRTLALEPEDSAPPAFSERDRSLLTRYVDRFNARDFDAVREMLTDEVRLELVARKDMNGRAQVQTYFHNYDDTKDWTLRLGFVDRHPAILVFTAAGHARPAYFILVQWNDRGIALIRDFRYASYAIDGADVALSGQ